SRARWEAEVDYATRIYRSRKWNAAHELLSFETAARRRRPSERLVVWENLILLRARSPHEASRKAQRYGRVSEGPVKIDGEDGYCKFRGLRDPVLIYDPWRTGPRTNGIACD